MALSQLMEYRVKLLEDGLSQVLGKLDELLTEIPMINYKLSQIENELDELNKQTSMFKEEVTALKSSGSPLGKMAPGAAAGVIITAVAQLIEYFKGN